MEDVLKKLTDDTHYYGEFGSQYFSNSDIGALLKNPNEFKKKREDDINLIRGRYFHQLILEPEKAKEFIIFDSSNRNTDKYKNYIKENNLEICLLKKEAEEVKTWTNKMMSNLKFYEDIMDSKNLFEQPAIKEIKGKIWKGKADIVTPNSLIDIKTSGDIKRFKYSAFQYNYDSQCYLYQKMFDKPLVFHVICKKTLELGIFKPSQDFIDSGENKVIKALEQYEKFFGDNPTHNIEDYYIEDVL